MAVKVVKAHLERIEDNSVGFVSLTPKKSSKLRFDEVFSNPLNSLRRNSEHNFLLGHMCSLRKVLFSRVQEFYNENPFFQVLQ